MLVLESYTDAEAIEVVAWRSVLTLASDLGLQTFRVGKRLCQCNEKHPWRGRYGPLVLEIKSRRKSFTRVEFVHEGRRSKFDAHYLAMRSVNLSLGRHIWFVAPMEFVLHIFFF